MASSRRSARSPVGCASLGQRAKTLLLFVRRLVSTTVLVALNWSLCVIAPAELVRARTKLLAAPTCRSEDAQRSGYERSARRGAAIAALVYMDSQFSVKE
eukprot:CAMPEP_0184748102 /NCGR_PEP_ID=MMETSP0315-20130426/16065_1 /TAXON_ID=101924 /ORGANISM="Rhodosorus marinus, Strain UTEX LB 2760" /LENGTH=99 /DNA_ID=CAMNT_0027222581 /DNA_START=140 /DNA_END=436 /DNA_ORIENTATION=+